MFVTGDNSRDINQVQGAPPMFDTTDIRRNVTAAFAAVLVSFALVGASFGPLNVGAPALAAVQPVIAG